MSFRKSEFESLSAGKLQVNRSAAGRESPTIDPSEAAQISNEGATESRSWLIRLDTLSRDHPLLADPQTD